MIQALTNPFKDVQWSTSPQENIQIEIFKKFDIVFLYTFILLLCASINIGLIGQPLRKKQDQTCIFFKS